MGRHANKKVRTQVKIKKSEEFVIQFIIRSSGRYDLLQYIFIKKKGRDGPDFQEKRAKDKMRYRGHYLPRSCDSHSSRLDHVNYAKHTSEKRDKNILYIYIIYI